MCLKRLGKEKGMMAIEEGYEFKLKVTEEKRLTGQKKII